MKIGIGNDHAAVDMKNQVVEYLEGKGYEVVNFGTAVSYTHLTLPTKRIV